MSSVRVCFRVTVLLSSFTVRAEIGMAEESGDNTVVATAKVYNSSSSHKHSSSTAVRLTTKLLPLTNFLSAGRGSVHRDERET